MSVEGLPSCATGDRPTAFLEHWEDLADPSRLAAVPVRAPRTGVLQTCRQLVDKAGDASVTKYWGKDAFTRCIDVKYLLAIRVTRATKPERAPNVDGKGSTSFRGGSVEGDVLVYRLEDAKHLGGFRFSAKSSAEADYQKLAEDLASNVGKAIDEAISKYIRAVS